MAVPGAAVGEGTFGSKVHAGMHPQQQQKQLEAEVRRAPAVGSWSQLVSGGVAGAVSKTFTAPLARLTILFQVRTMRSDLAVLGKPTMVREASRIIHEEGMTAFWKGNGVTVIHRLPYSAINFFAYEQYKAALLNLVNREDGTSSEAARSLTRFLAGGAAGVTSAAATYPLDLIRTRLASETTSRHYKGILHSLVTIGRQEGIFGLYKGLWPTLLCVGPTIALNFCVFEGLQSYWISRSPDSSRIATNLICGGLSGIVASTVTFPVDLVKRRMQLEGDARWRPSFKQGISSTMRYIIRSEGYRGLYRGILPEYFKVFPGVGIAFMMYDFMKTLTATSSS